jgi:hypothetical protein
VAKKQIADAAKAKQAKQKKIVIILAVVMVLAMAYAVNTMMGMSGGGGAKPVAASVSATQVTVTTPAPTTGAAPTLAGTPTTTTTAAPTDSSTLVAVVTPPADPGQLQSFTRFASKDPFDPKPTPGPGPGPGPGPKDVCPNLAGVQTSVPSGDELTAGKCIPIPPPCCVPQPTTRTSAVLSVNGTEESVNSGADFPASNPIFLLNSLQGTTAKVSIAGGSYASGQATVTLKVNQPLTLVNTATGTQYTLLLLPVGTVPPAATSTGSSSSGSSAPTTTTPTTTTSTGP